MYWGTWNDNNVQARKLWEEDKKRREVLASNPSLSTNFKKDSGSLNRPVAQSGFKKKSDIKGSKSFEWEKTFLHDLPKSMGRSYDDKFKAYTKMLGLGEGESDDFRKFLDAKEKGKLTSDNMTEAMKDAVNRARWYKTEKQDEEPIVPKERGTLDRIFSPLLIGNYASANVADALLSGKGVKGALKGAWAGVKASNPFGDGYEKGKKTYSDVLNKHVYDKGGKATVDAMSLIGGVPGYFAGKFLQNVDNEGSRSAERLSKSVNGLALDVLLDPTTYMTFGGTALVKGTGRVGASSKTMISGVAKTFGIEEKVKGSKQLYEKVLMKNIQDGKSVTEATKLAESAKTLSKGTMTPELAREIVTTHQSQAGVKMTEEQISHESERLMSKYHELIGTNRKAEGLGIGFKHSLLNPVIRGLGGGSRIANKMADFHVTIPGSAKVMQTIGQHTVAPVFSKVRKQLYGGVLGKMFSTKHGLMKLAESDPARVYDFLDSVSKSQGHAMDMLKDKQLFMDYAKQNLQDLTPAESAKLFEALQDKTVFSKIKRFTSISDMNEAQALKHRMTQERDAVQTQLDDLANQKNELEQLRSANQKELDGSNDVFKQAEWAYYDSLNKLDLTSIKDEEQYKRALDLLQKQSDEIEQRLGEIKPPEKPEEITFNEPEPAKPTRPYTKNPKKPELSDVPEKPAHPEAPKLGDFIKEDVTPLQYEGSGVLENWARVNKDGRPNQLDINKSVDEFSQLIYGKTGEISPAVYPFALDDLAKLVQEGRNANYIKSFIDGRKMYYDGRAKDIFSHVSDLFQYGGEHKYKSWEEFYTKRAEVIHTKMEKGEATQGDYNLLTHLETVRAKRAMIVSQLSHLDKAELKAYLNDVDVTRMWESFRAIENRNVKGLDSSEEARRSKFTNEDRALDGTDSEITRAVKDEKTGDYKVVKRYVENKNLRTGEFDDKAPFKQEISDVDSEEIRGHVLNELQFGFNFSRAVKDKVSGKMVKGKRLDIKEITPAHIDYANQVVAEMSSTLKNYFPTKNWSDLSPAQKKFAIGISKDNAYRRSRGLSVKGESKPETPEAVKKKLKEEAERRDISAHSEAVKASVTNGTPIIWKNEKGIRMTGTVIGINHDLDGTVLYNIRNAKGEVIKDITPISVVQVNKQKPLDLVLHNTMEREAMEKLNQASREYEAEVKRLDAEYEAKVKEAENANSEKLAQYKEEMEQIKKVKEEKKAQYDADMEKYNQELGDYITRKQDVELTNQANLADWEKALKESSDLADDFLTRKQALADEMDKLHGIKKQADEGLDRKRAQVESEWQQRYQDSISHMSELEKINDDIRKQLDALDNTDISPLLSRKAELEDVLKSEDAFENYVQLKHADELKMWDHRNGNPMRDLGKLVLDTRTDYSEKVKRIAKELRSYFDVMGHDEMEIGKLTKEQYHAWVGAYVPHIATPEGQKFFKEYTLKFVDGEVKPVPRVKGAKTPSVTQDMGYGEAFSEFGLSRKIKKLKMPDGTWVENPTIAQINEVMKPFLKGKNAFSDSISDIFVARALKHTELMYDEKYMQTMMRTFGEDITNYTPKKGFKTVMNVGLLQKNFDEMASLQTSMHISDAVTEHVQNELMPQMTMMNPLEREKFLNDEIEKFMQANFPQEEMKRLREQFLDESYKLIEQPRVSFREKATPMVELEPKHHELVERVYGSVVSDFEARITAQEKKFMKYPPNAEQAERLARNKERLANLQPLEIKQVHGSIMDKANSARKLQVAKDSVSMVKLYDKFQHFMKLNQTTIMPSFHARNSVSNMFQVWLAVGNDIFDMEMHTHALQTMMKDGSMEALKDLPPVVGKNGQVYAWDEIYNLAHSHGVVNEGFFAKDIGANDASNGIITPLQNVQIKGKKLSFDPTDTANFTPYQVGSSFGNAVENQARLFQFASHLKQGMSPEQAKAMVDKFLFDYGDLTGFEKTVMKRIFPYYTWLRKNGKLQLSQVFEQPGKYRDVAKWMNSIESGVDEDNRVESQYLAPFAREWKQTIFNYMTTDEDGNQVVEPVLWNPNLPFMDFARLPLNPLDAKGNIMKMLPQTNPLIKGVAELSTNKNFFFDDRIWDEQSDKQSDGAYQAYKTGKIAEYIATQFAPYTAVRDTFKKDGVDKGLHLLNQTTGQKFLSYDYATSKDMTIKKYMGWGKKEKELWVDKQLNKLEMMPDKERGNVTRILDDYINGKTLTKENTGKYYPFVSVMQKVGLDNAKTRKWVTSTVHSTHLEKYLLGSDFVEAKVAGVRDGDTIDVIIDGKKEGIRFNLVDTPETVDPRYPNAMPFGKEASDQTHSLFTEGKDIRLVLSKNKDKYDRYVAYVYLDGEDYNKKLLEQGYAQNRYVSLSTNPYREDEYRKAQASAVEDNKGIWQIDGYANAEEDKPYSHSPKMMEEYLKLMGSQGNKEKTEYFKKLQAWKDKVDNYNRFGQ